ncbi:uncharacterized protein NEMAJ01_1094 [Nematocida major]|uniref:uncharacterized protein n=1 Tax=Nematocida major TaxID=1912982 RepID=UPI002007B23C|nr:uncharacterized protein NEMAJ01_1094 [Nematocida major]KAH9386198.1 hypothetical protein NEMAJ01_1094 [Nematocida major]
MKNWKVVKPQQAKAPKPVRKAKCNRFRCLAILVGIIAILYAGFYSGCIGSMAEKVSNMPELQGVFKNEYFILAKRTAELAMLRVEILLIGGCAIARKMLCCMCTGVSGVLEKIPGYDKLKITMDKCEYCNCIRSFLLNAQKRGQNLLNSLLEKAKELKGNK